LKTAFLFAGEVIGTVLNFEQVQNIGTSPNILSNKEGSIEIKSNLHNPTAYIPEMDDT
jgi:hypothetical protein